MSAWLAGSPMRTAAPGAERGDARCAVSQISVLQGKVQRRAVDELRLPGAVVARAGGERRRGGSEFACRVGQLWIAASSGSGHQAPSAKPLSGEPHLRVPPAAGHPLPLPSSQDPPNRRFEAVCGLLRLPRHPGIVTPSLRHRRGQPHHAPRTWTLALHSHPHDFLMRRFLAAWPPHLRTRSLDAATIPSLKAMRSSGRSSHSLAA